MEKVINLRLPHIGEQVFEIIDTDGLIQLLEVSTTWKILAENVLLKRWKGKMFEACESRRTEIVKLLLEYCNSEESGFNTKDRVGGTVFMAACFYGPKDIVQLLLNHPDTNIDLNEKSENHLTAFMLACMKGNKDIVQLLLSPKTKYKRPKTKHKRPRPRPTKQTKVSTKNWYFNAYVTVLKEHSEGTFAPADFVLHFLSNKRTEAIFDNFSLY